MLTRSGLVTLLASVAVLASGRVFGLVELYVIGTGGVALLLLAISFTAVRRLQVEVSRHLSPSQVHAGNPCRVDLVLRNRSWLRSPVLRLRDDVSGTRGVELMVAPMASNGGTQAVYRLPTDRRGLVHVGPLRLTVHDPFGLARLTTTGDRDMSLVVFPRVDPLAPVRRASGADLERFAARQHHVAPSGEEFHALREYQLGDDLRRIHWPSSARHDELMVRQNELPWHGRVTVLLDAGRAAELGTDGDADFEARFEQMVSAAASIASASIERGDQVRLLCTSGADTAFGSGNAHLSKILSELALVEPDDHPLGSTIERLAAPGSGGVLVTVTTGEGRADDVVLRRTAGTFGSRVIVVFGEGGAMPAGSGGALRSTTVIPVRPGATFPDAWQQVFGPSRSRRQ